MFKVKFWNGRPFDPYIETDWQWLIRLAWGKRRLSSRVSAEFRARYEDPSMPGYLRHGKTGANLGMWIAWWRRNRKMRFDHVIIEDDREGYGAAYAAELLRKAMEAEATRAKAAERAEVMASLEDLQRQRAEARALKDFALADKIRDRITAAGLTVKDDKVSG